jgi:hypothetical protein
VSLFLCADADITDGRDVLCAYLCAMVTAVHGVDPTTAAAASAATEAAAVAAAEVIAAVAAGGNFTRGGELGAAPPWLDGALGVIQTWCEQQSRPAHRARFGGNSAALSASIRQRPEDVAASTPVSLMPVEVPPVVPATAAVDFAARGQPAARRAASEREAGLARQLAEDNHKLQVDVARQAEIITARTASKDEHERSAAQLAKTNEKLVADIAQSTEARGTLETQTAQLAAVHKKLNDGAEQLRAANTALAARSANTDTALGTCTPELKAANAADKKLKAAKVAPAARLAAAEAALAQLDALKKQDATERANAESALADLKTRHAAAMSTARDALTVVQARFAEAESLMRER